VRAWRPDAPAQEARPVSIPLLSQLGGGAAAVVLGAFPVLAAVGLIETEGGIEPFARVLAFVFGAVFVTIGGVLIGQPLLAIARKHGAVTRSDAVTLAWRHLVRRVTWTSLGAAAGVAVLALGSWLAVGGIAPSWVGGTDGLRALVLIEFLVIHGFPFLVFAALFFRNTRGRARVVTTGILGVLLFLYGAMAWKAGDGIWGLVALLYLLMPNVLAFAKADSPVSGRVLVVSRWVIKLALLLLTIGIIGGGSFDGPETVWVGAVYFTLLGGVEAFRVVEIPGEVAAAER